jgi:hypothetical protein
LAAVKIAQRFSATGRDDWLEMARSISFGKYWRLLKIAQRFSAGDEADKHESRQGRKNAGKD